MEIATVRVGAQDAKEKYNVRKTHIHTYVAFMFVHMYLKVTIIG
jgi:hypothetical protein